MRSIDEKIGEALVCKQPSKFQQALSDSITFNVRRPAAHAAAASYGLNTD